MKKRGVLHVMDLNQTGLGLFSSNADSLKFWIEHFPWIVLYVAKLSVNVRLE